jgi:hypothetical protein
VQLPDFAHMTSGQIAGFLVGVAFAVWLAGVGKAIVSRTVLWTYTAEWLSGWLVKAAICLGLTIVGNGIPGIIEPNDLVKAAVVPALLSYAAAAAAAIAKSFGLDLSKLPLASNVYAAFEPARIRASAPVSPTGNGPATPPNT